MKKLLSKPSVHPEAEIRILRASVDDRSMDIKLP